MKKVIVRSKKTGTKEKITFSEGLKIVRAIQKKIEELQKTKPSTHTSNEYSL